MLQIRYNIFETNSSSTHSLILMSKQQYHDWQNGENSYIELHDEAFITPDKIHVYSWDEIKELYKQYNERRHRSSTDEATDSEIKQWATWAGYLDAESCDYIYGEYEDLVVISAYISE